MDYYVEDAMDVIKNLKNNPYGVKDSYHSIDRARLRDVDLNVVTRYIAQGFLVGIEKSLNENGIFRLLYEHTKFFDLAIVINILDEDEVLIMTVVEKRINGRRHYGN